MTHLRIELNNNVEILGSSSNDIGVRIILKLYEIANGGLDGTSKLLGNVLVYKAYRNDVDWLNNNTDLTVNVTDDYYISFLDPEASRILNSMYGDGIGVTETAASQVTSTSSNVFEPFKENTTIQTFDEMKYFTSITRLRQRGLYYNPTGAFKNCTSLLTIDMRNVISVDSGSFAGCFSLRELKNFHPVSLTADDPRGGCTFEGCSNLLEIDCSQLVIIPGKCFNICSSLNNIVNLHSVQKIGLKAFYNCANLKIDVNLPNLGKELTGLGNSYTSTKIEYSTFKGSGIISISDLGDCQLIGGGSYIENWRPGAFADCANLRFGILPRTLTEIQESAFYNDTALEYIKCLATTPPTLRQTDPSNDNYPFKNTTCKFYVPDASLSSYQAAAGWDYLYTSNRLFPLSQFATDFPNE